MSTLYAPIVGNRSPGFYEEDGSIYITVPYEHNRAVSSTQVSGMALKIRSIQNEYDPTEGVTPQAENYIQDSKTVTFVLNDSYNLNVGQFYKLQIAQVDSTDNTLGYYSTVTISKFTTKPTITISNKQQPNGIGDDVAAVHTYSYQGNYTQQELGDYTEKVYYYRFVLKHGTTVLKDTGYLIHDASTDENEQSSHDTFTYFNLLPQDQGSFNRLTYEVITNTGINLSKTVTLVQEVSEVAGWGCTNRLDYDNAYVSLTQAQDSVVPAGLTEADLIRYTWDGAQWNDGIRLATFDLDELVKGKEIFKDFLVEQGQRYCYCLGGDTEEGVTRSPLDECTVRVDFEDIFLYRPDRQLKIRFNGKVNQIHETLQETKVETLGGRYPYFFRNGAKRYRDFTITGVLSFQGDEQNLFSSLYGLPPQPSRERTYTTAAQTDSQGNPYEYLQELQEQGQTSSFSDYTVGNYFRERKFREEIQAWLTDGLPKYFKSAPEGNLVVQIMSVNMTPFDSTSRMVYQISMQAYECAGTDYDSLVENKIII